MRGAPGSVYDGDTRGFGSDSVDVVEPGAAPTDDLDVRQTTVHLGGDPAPPACQHGAYLVEWKVGVQLDRVRHLAHMVGSFEQSERIGMHRFEQNDHLASRNSGSKSASSKIAGSTY